jgi:hypothetical protein
VPRSFFILLHENLSCSSSSYAKLTASRASLLQFPAVLTISCSSFSPKRVFSEYTLPMTNPRRSARVSSGSLEPKASTALKRKSGKASTPGPQTKRSKSKPKSERTLKDLTNNPIVRATAAEIHEIKVLSKSEDDPPIIFIWDSKNLGVFLQNMVRMPGRVAIPPPPQLQPVALAGIGPPDDSSKEILARCILDYLQSRVPGIVRFSNDRAGFSCTQIQVANVVAELGDLHTEPWFAAVCSVGQLGGPLAEYFVPRPRSNLIDRIRGKGPLWSNETNSTFQGKRN